MDLSRPALREPPPELRPDVPRSPTRSPLPLPGTGLPAAGFELPFEMLSACHDRVRRSLALLGRLVEHVAAQGHDEASRSAARDVLRYFDLAAPHHHEDEERHVFPALLARGDAALAADIARLQADHLRMAALWQALRPRLQAWAEATAPAPGDAPVRAAADAFRAIYADHLELEDQRVFPAAHAAVDAATQAAMGAEMAARRRA